MSTTAIAAIRARQIFDSRGRPTVEADVELRGGARGRASVPSGASTGGHEACELRDGDRSMHAGLGVHRAVGHVDGEIARALEGRDALAQADIDALLLDLDGTPLLERLGANAVLATSLAVCRAAAVSQSLPLFSYIAALSGTVRPSLPMPMVNILSGGAHARLGMDVQDFLIVPVGATSFDTALRIALDVRRAADAVLAKRGYSTLLADEGGLSPGCDVSTDALDLLIEAIETAGLEPSRDVAIAIDVAATGLFADGIYAWRNERVRRTTGEMIDMVLDWQRRYPVVSVEDALHEDDWAGWRRLVDAAPDLQIVGDDLFATNVERIRRGIATTAANAALIKLNQNGTLSGTLEAIAAARAAGFGTIVSARSGETDDAFIADLAVGTSAGQIKIGSVRASERMAKYNALVRISEASLPFAGVARSRERSVKAAVADDFTEPEVRHGSVGLGVEPER